MESWVERALAKWPNVPHLYGWIHLDRRGRWSLKGERVDRPKLVDMMRHNFAADERGAWYFQNGPQRGYVALEYTPLVAQAMPDGQLQLHTDATVRAVDAVYLDSDGTVVLSTEYGAAVLNGADLGWVMQRLISTDAIDVETNLEQALASPSGSPTRLRLEWEGSPISVNRCDAHALPETLGFQRDPQPELNTE